MTLLVWNILFLLDQFGEEYVNHFLSTFSTKMEKDNQIIDLNPDIEEFLKCNAVQFAKERKSITYLVGDADSGTLLGYFTLTHKVIEINAAGLSNTSVRRIERHSRINPETNSYLVSAFLIAQFGKNYNVDERIRLSGDDLMSFCKRELNEIRYRIGGSVIYLDCEADARLIRFYQDQQKFTLFGERISDNDGKRYLQYMKFL
ncbi:MAG: hypothetical protein IJI57_03255 [Flexilinea sp.]|nr:hypothetical protein [Flexilinea sp.]